MISTNELKNGDHIEVDGTIFEVLDFQHVKRGKDGAFVRTKPPGASDGNVIDKTFRATGRFRSVHTEGCKMQYLYSDGTDAHFMDAQSSEQIAVPEASVADALRWTNANDSIDVLFIDGNPGDLQLPSSVEFEVPETEHRPRGDTACGDTACGDTACGDTACGDTASGGGEKLATLETGAQIRLPLLVNSGDRVRVQTATGDDMSRA